MKFAIDRYITGLEKEVSADEFFGKYIPRRNNRFYCPECGLQVFWVSKGGNQPNKFKHPPKTENSPECDKRVDGRSDLYLYERVGLPVYLSRLTENSFQLSISFPAVGSKMLANAALHNATVIIRGNGRNRSVPINANNFYSDSTTLIPLNFLPQVNGRFKIEVTPANSYSRKWSDYAEGFTSSGAIFAFDEAGGKKIHRDDSISPGRQYYLVSRQFSCPYHEVNCKPVGTLNLLDGSYQVYCMTVNASLQNEQRYAQISDFFRRKFGIGLLTTAPEIIPLWPPVIERDALIPTKNSRVFCEIASGNDDPTVYSYTGNQVISIPIHTGSHGEKHIFVNVSAADTVLSVDRKYVGREVVFRSKEIPFGGQKYEYSLLNSLGETVEPDQADANIFANGGSITANAKMDLYLGSTDHNYLHIHLRDNHTLLPTFQNAHEILMLVDGSIIFSHILQSPKENCREGCVSLGNLLDYSCGEYIPVPRWAFHVIEMIRQKGSIAEAQEILRHIVNGKLPVGIIRALEKMRQAARSG